VSQRYLLGKIISDTSLGKAKARPSGHDAVISDVAVEVPCHVTSGEDLP